MSKWDAQEIKRLYEVEKLSQSQIAKAIGCKQADVCRYMKRQGIKSRLRSEACSLSVKRGQDHHLFRHGKDKKGYARQRVNKKETLIHRHVASQVLGRPLKQGEQVHHCNGIKSDNSKDNLWVFPDCKSHRSYHATGEIHPQTLFLKDYK
jgi:predicted transcriptional regulator